MYYGVSTAAGDQNYKWFWMPIDVDSTFDGLLSEGDQYGNERDVVHVSATPVYLGHNTGYYYNDFIRWRFESKINWMRITANADSPYERTMEVYVKGDQLYYQSSTGISGHGPVGRTYIPSAGWCNSQYDYTPCEGRLPNLLLYWEDAKHLSHGNEYALYIDALDSVAMEANNIANIAEVVSIIRSLVSGNALKCISKTTGVAEDVLKTLSKRDIKALCKGTLTTAGDAWLKYRYAYLTTTSDIEDIASKIKTINNQVIVGRSTGSVMTNFGTAVTHCKVAVNQKTGNSVLDFWKTLKKYGLAPDLYNIWDMIPFSFIADWFFQIGDKAEALSSEWKTSNLYFGLIGGCYSTRVETTDYSLGYPSTVTLYKRTAMRNFPNVDLDLEKSNPSTKTSIKRLADGGALLVNMN